MPGYGEAGVGGEQAQADARRMQDRCAERRDILAAQGGSHVWNSLDHVRASHIARSS